MEEVLHCIITWCLSPWVDYESVSVMSRECFIQRSEHALHAVVWRRSVELQRAIVLSWSDGAYAANYRYGEHRDDRKWRWWHYLHSFLLKWLEIELKYVSLGLGKTFCVYLFWDNIETKDWVWLAEPRMEFGEGDKRRLKAEETGRYL